jgi:hypothetical protein
MRLHSAGLGGGSGREAETGMDVFRRGDGSAAIPKWKGYRGLWDWIKVNWCGAFTQSNASAFATDDSACRVAPTILWSGGCL